jgi:hypothetical protein
MLQMPGRRAVLAALAGSFMAVQASRAESMRMAEREVVAAYLNNLETDEPMTKVVVIASATSTMSEAFVGIGDRSAARVRLAQMLPQATNAVIDDFLRVLSESVSLQIPGHLVRKDLRYRMAGQRELDRLFDERGKGWLNFYKAYPDASCLVRLSRPGLDEEAGQALVFMSIRGGMARGAGFFELLQRRFGIWRSAANAKAWIS